VHRNGQQSYSPEAWAAAQQWAAHQQWAASPYASFDPYANGYGPTPPRVGALPIFQVNPDAGKSGINWAEIFAGAFVGAVVAVLVGKVLR
jgi:hypothetical protein